MDVWAWVEELQQELANSGQIRVAQLIDRLPTAVSESDPIADAIAPELLAVARAMGNPWLEVYARHWHLQYLVGTMNQGTVALSYATESLERAHRPDTKDCPQSVCTTQDISMAYEAVDCFSFAKEREAVSRETLERVNPSWNCYDCIHRELIDALADQGRFEEARETLDRSRAELEAADNEPSPGYIVSSARLHIQEERPDLAVMECEAGEEGADDEPSTTQTSRRIVWTTANRMLENFEDAAERFPSFETILTERTLSSSWALEALALVEAGALENTAELGGALETLLQHSDRVGSLRTTLNVGYAHGCLAAARGVRWVSEEALGVMTRTFPQLKQDHGASQQITDLSRRIEAVADIALPVPASELGEYLNTSPTEAEVDVALIRQGMALAPDDADLPLYLGISYANARQFRLLLEHFKQLEETPVATNPGYVALVRTLTESDLPTNVVDAEIKGVGGRLAADSDPKRQFVGHRMLADLHFQRDRYAECVAACERAIEIESDAPGTRRLLAMAATQDKQFEKARDQYQLLVHDVSEPSGLDWDLLSVSTALDDWATVRTCAAKLGITVPGTEGPIYEDVAFCQVLLPGYSGGLAPWSAIRTGPATARVIEVSNPKADFQYFDARVVIDLAPVNESDKEEMGDDWEPIFPVVFLKQLGTHKSWIVDGAQPEAEQWAHFRDTLREENWGVWSATWQGYTVNDPASNEQIDGIYAFVASPPELTAKEVDVRLHAMTSEWKHPMAWPVLAEAAGANVAYHEDIVGRFEL
jgi:tetratricopeptide (TPR) repeat protein